MRRMNVGDRNWEDKRAKNTAGTEIITKDTLAHLQAFADFLEIALLLLLDDTDHFLADFADLGGLCI